MIEIQIPYTHEREEIASVGHNGTNFLALSITNAHQMNQYQAKIYKLKQPNYNPTLIHSMERCAFWFHALKPNENGQIFKEHENDSILVNPNNECSNIKITSNDYLSQQVISDSECYETDKYIFIFKAFDEKIIHYFFKTFLNTKIPEFNFNDIIMFDKSTKEVEVFEFSDKINAIIANPEQSILCVATKNKLYFMDI